MTEHCEVVVTPEGLVRECIDPDLRRISYDTLSVGPGADTEPTQSVHPLLFAAQRMVWERERRQSRVEDAAAAIEAEGFMLAWQRLLDVRAEIAWHGMTGL